MPHDQQTSLGKVLKAIAERSAEANIVSCDVSRALDMATLISSDAPGVIRSVTFQALPNNKVRLIAGGVSTIYCLEKAIDAIFCKLGSASSHAA